MRYVFILFLVGFFFPHHPVAAQARNNAGGIGVALPVGDFSSTHLAGVTLDYKWGKARFGSMPSKPRKAIGFMAQGSAGYYLGKKEKVNGIYDYKNPAYYHIGTFAGAIYNPVKQFYFSLTAGPGIGMDNGTVNFTPGAILETGYYMSYKIMISPGIIIIKENGTDPLFSVFLKVGMVF